MFSSTTIVASMTMFAGALASTGATLEPFMAGVEWGVERPLSDHTRSLTVVASKFEDGNIVRIAGADLELRRHGSPKPFATATTGEDGRAFFELRTGGYFLKVRWNGHEDENGVNVWEDERRGIYFDDKGSAYWRRISHEQLEQDGDVATLGVRISDARLCDQTGDGAEYCRGVPPPGAHYLVFKVHDGERGEKVADFWDHGQRDPSRILERAFEPNWYDLRAEYDGALKDVRILLLCDMYPRFTYQHGSLSVRDADCNAREPVAVL